VFVKDDTCRFGRCCEQPERRPGVLGIRSRVARIHRGAAFSWGRAVLACVRLPSSGPKQVARHPGRSRA